MGFVGPILINLWTSSIWGFPWLPVWWPLRSYLCKHAGDHSVTTEACSSPHLTCLGLCGMAAWKLNGAICPMNEGSEARKFSGWELRWWGRTVGDGLLGVPVVGGWLLGTPVVGMYGGAVVGSSLGSLRICDSRGTLGASVDVVVVSVGTTWAWSVGRAMWTRGRGFGLWLPLRGERLRFLGLWVTQWNSWWGRGAIRASSSRQGQLRVWQCFHTCVYQVLQLSSVLVWPYSFSAGGTGACFPQKLSISSSFPCGWWPLFHRGHPWRGAAPPWIGVSPVLGGGWGWNIPLCGMGATSGRGSLPVPSSNPGVALQGKRYGPGWPCHCTFQPIFSDPWLSSVP